MDKKFQGKYRNGTFRLQSWNYGFKGEYFITICTRNRKHYFGEVIDGEMVLNTIGKIAEEEWIKSTAIRSDMNLTLGEFQVMPNHFHWIIRIGANKFNTLKLLKKDELLDQISYASSDSSRTSRKSILLHKAPGNYFGPQRKNLASIIRGFKGWVKREAGKAGFGDFNWQSLYHEHIIRNRKAYYAIERYIRNNPKNWNRDRFGK